MKKTVFKFETKDCTTCIYFKKTDWLLANDYCEYSQTYLKTHDRCNCWIDKDGNEN